MKKIKRKNVISGGAELDTIWADVSNAIESYYACDGMAVNLVRLSELPVRWGGIFLSGHLVRQDITDKVLFRIACSFYKDVCKEQGLGIGIVKKHGREKGVLIYWRRG